MADVSHTCDGGGRPLRLALLATPRSGNNWLRRLLSHACEIPHLATHAPHEVDWDALPPECIFAIHWHPVPDFLDRLVRHAFRPLVLVRHPLDVLVSVLHFSLFSDTDRWLEGEGGNEQPVRGAMPRSAPFLGYATGPRAAALLAVGREWWHHPGAGRVRYEDLVRDPEGAVRALLESLGAGARRPVAEAVGSMSLTNLRASTGVPHHFWQGQIGLWRRLLTAAEARAITDAHAGVFAELGYTCDPDPDLTPDEADANWLRLVWPEVDERLGRLPRAEEEAARVGGELAGLRASLARAQDESLSAWKDLAGARGELAAALGAAAALRAERDALVGSCEALRVERDAARRDLLDLGQLAADLRARYEPLESLGPNALRAARRLHDLGRRFPGTARHFWQVVRRCA
jgi:hypothetical protein